MGILYVPDINDYLLSISFCISSCFLLKTALLKHEALQFYMISSRTRTTLLHTNSYNIVFCSCLIKERKSMKKFKQPRAHFQRHTSKRGSLSLFLADTAQLPVILSRQCQAPYWVFSCAFSLWIYLSPCIYIWFKTSKRFGKNLLTVISHCFLIMFSAHCLQCVLKFV